MPPSVSRDGQIGPRCDEQLAQDGGGRDPPAGRRGRRDDRTGRRAAASSARPKIAGAAATVRPSRRSRSARPATPTSGLASPTWKPRQAPRRRVRSSSRASARSGSPGPRRERAVARTWRGSRAPALPSGRSSRPDAASRKRQSGPAPASSSTLTMARSNVGARPRRAVAPRSACRDLAQRSQPSMHEMPPARMERNVEDRDRPRA